MPTFTAADGVNIYYEVAGQGYPLLLSHEFAGDITSWEPQVNFFTRRYRVITYCHRGYPPSDVPDDPAAYSQERLVSDMRDLLLHLGIEQAYIGGLSMGGSAAVSFAIAPPGDVPRPYRGVGGFGNHRPRAAAGVVATTERTDADRGNGEVRRGIRPTARSECSSGARIR